VVAVPEEELVSLQAEVAEEAVRASEEHRPLTAQDPMQ